MSLSRCAICGRRDTKLPNDFNGLMDFLQFRFDSLDISYSLNGRTHTADDRNEARIQISVGALLKCFEDYAKWVNKN